MSDNQPSDFNQPVAYDKDGRPLYAHPAEDAQADNTAPQIVQISRSADPMPVHVSDDAMARHEASQAKYPLLHLSKGEYVITEVRRHFIGQLAIYLVGGFLIAAIIAGMLLYPSIQKTSSAQLPPFDTILLPAGLLIVLILLGAYIALWVYQGNRFYLTNESIIQEIQTTLMSRKEQTISLESIEDASFKQIGIMQTMFDYGSIRLSTVGGETTYRFTYVASPDKQIDVLNDAVENFKNGRPVEH